MDESGAIKRAMTSLVSKNWLTLFCYRLTSACIVVWSESTHDDREQIQSQSLIYGVYGGMWCLYMSSQLSGR